MIGFDLDMTLVDSRPGFLETVRILALETGTALDADAIVRVERLTAQGVRLEETLSLWLPPDAVDRAAQRFRTLYRENGIPLSSVLPGAADALAYVARRSGTSVVVTGKYEPNAHAELAAADLVADTVVGWHWGARKAEPLRRLGAVVYVGDTPGDIEGAHAAGALAVAVTTGAHDAAELCAAGADVVLTTLEDLPDLLDARVARDPRRR